MNASWKIKNLTVKRDILHPNADAEEDSQKNAKQGKRTSAIQDMEGGRDDVKRSSCLEERWTDGSNLCEERREKEEIV